MILIFITYRLRDKKLFFNYFRVFNPLMSWANINILLFSPTDLNLISFPTFISTSMNVTSLTNHIGHTLCAVL